MNRDVFETQWVQVRGVLRDKYSNLSDEDIRQIDGRYDQLVAKLQQKYGYTREEAEESLRNWNIDRFATRTNVRDDRVEKKSDPFLTWLLALGIPLLLLGLYFFNRTPETTTTTPRDQTIYESPAPAATTRDQILQERPADMTVSTSLRNALLAQPNLVNAVRNVQVTTNNGVVTLSGTVPNDETSNAIERLASRFTGVKEVINNLEVQ